MLASFDSPPPKEYRTRKAVLLARAQSCRRMASSASSQERADQLLGLARQWEALAAYATD